MYRRPHWQIEIKNISLEYQLHWDMLLVSEEGKFFQLKIGAINQNKRASKYFVFILYFRATGFTTRSDIGPARDANDVS